MDLGLPLPTGPWECRPQPRIPAHRHVTDGGHAFPTPNLPCSGVQVNSDTTWRDPGLRNSHLLALPASAHGRSKIGMHTVSLTASLLGNADTNVVLVTLGGGGTLGASFSPKDSGSFIFLGPHPFSAPAFNPSHIRCPQGWTTHHGCQPESPPPHISMHFLSTVSSAGS